MTDFFDEIAIKAPHAAATHPGVSASPKSFVFSLAALILFFVIQAHMYQNILPAVLHKVPQNYHS